MLHGQRSLSCGPQPGPVQLCVWISEDTWLLSAYSPVLWPREPSIYTLSPFLLLSDEEKACRCLLALHPHCPSSPGHALWAISRGDVAHPRRGHTT